MAVQQEHLLQNRKNYQLKDILLKLNVFIDAVFNFSGFMTMKLSIRYISKPRDGVRREVCFVNKKVARVSFRKRRNLENCVNGVNFPDRRPLQDQR